jgi:hypothetical protein
MSSTEDFVAIGLESFQPSVLEDISFEKLPYRGEDGYFFVKLNKTILVYTEEDVDHYFTVGYTKYGKAIMGIAHWTPTQSENLKLLEELLMAHAVSSLGELHLLSKSILQRNFVNCRIRTSAANNSVNCELRYHDRKECVDNMGQLKDQLHGRRRRSRLGFSIRTGKCNNKNNLTT